MKERIDEHESPREQTPAKSYNHWLNKIVDDILARDHEVIALSTGKTPSGHIHLGILRELLICDGLRRIFEDMKKPVKFRLFLDSLDAAKRFPAYIPKNFQKEFLGYPFAYIPDPMQSSEEKVVKDTEKNYAEVFGEELISTFDELGIKVEPVWSHKLYSTEEMQEKIRIGLAKNEKVKEIVAKYITASMTEEQKAQYLEQQKDWMAAMVICEKCNRIQKRNSDGTISPNRVKKFNKDEDTVEYKCPACGYEGKIAISSGRVKLNWRLDWPAKWSIFHTTCEPAGKDHCTPGGSYDTGLELCREIYGYEGPVKVAYEWLRLGDRDMKTSKGIVFTPRKFLDMADAEIIRMLIYTTDPNKHISIRVEEMENYYNEFHRIERIFYGLEDAQNEAEKKEIQFLYPLISAGDVPDKWPPRLPFKMEIVLTQLLPILGPDKVYERAVEYMRREKYPDVISKENLMKRLRKMENWLEEIRGMLNTEKDPKLIKIIKSKVPLFSILEEVPEDLKQRFSDKQKEAFMKFIEKSRGMDSYTNDDLKRLMMEIRKEIGIGAQQFFQAFYLAFLGQKKGPRLGPLMEMMEKDWIIKRLEEVLS